MGELTHTGFLGSPVVQTQDPCLLPGVLGSRGPYDPQSLSRLCWGQGPQVCPWVSWGLWLTWQWKSPQILHQRPLYQAFVAV